jgi:hypothetical protein
MSTVSAPIAVLAVRARCRARSIREASFMTAGSVRKGD